MSFWWRDASLPKIPQKRNARTKKNAQRESPETASTLAGFLTTRRREPGFSGLILWDRIICLVAQQFSSIESAAFTHQFGTSD